MSVRLLKPTRRINSAWIAPAACEDGLRDGAKSYPVTTFTFRSSSHQSDQLTSSAVRLANTDNADGSKSNTLLSNRFASAPISSYPLQSTIHQPPTLRTVVSLYGCRSNQLLSSRYQSSRITSSPILARPVAKLDYAAGRKSNPFISCHVRFVRSPTVASIYFTSSKVASCQDTSS